MIPVGTSLKDVRLKLAQEEAADMARAKEKERANRVSRALKKVPPSVFLVVGLELEEQQCVIIHCTCMPLTIHRRGLRMRTKGKQTVAEQAVTQERRNALMRRIESWKKVQRLHTPSVIIAETTGVVSAASTVAIAGNTASPAVAPVNNNDNEDDDGEDATDANANPSKRSLALAENVPLWLPSALPDSLRADPAMARIVSTEIRLREAQAYDALAEIRRLRRIITGLHLFKRLNIDGTGNRSTTRILSSYKSFQSRVDRCAERYRAAYAALATLDRHGAWSKRLRPLLKDDIRGPGRDDDDEVPNEGRRELSWIWLVPGVAQTERVCDVKSMEFMDGVRVEWARTRARAQRWAEEKILLSTLR